MSAQLAMSAAVSAVDTTPCPDRGIPSSEPVRRLTDAQKLARMQAGQRAAAQRRRKESVRRVRAFDRWLRDTHGQPAAVQFRALADLQARLGRITDHDFRVARGEV